MEVEVKNYQNLFSNIEIKEIPAAAPEMKRFHSRSFALMIFKKKNEIEIIKNTTISCPNSIPKLNQKSGLIIDDLSKIKALK